MKASFAMFGGSMLFGMVEATAYWFDTKEPAGTMFLGMMGIAFGLVLVWLFGTRKSTQYDGDGERSAKEMAGEHIAVVSTESPWPILLALATAGFVIGTILHPMLGFLAVLAVFTVFWQLVREST